MAWVGTSWVGAWRNQFGSILRIISDAEGRIEGTFETALEDSGFYGQTVQVTGFHRAIASAKENHRPRVIRRYLRAPRRLLYLRAMLAGGEQCPEHSCTE
ncbi:avidin/streptavidin family protein [Bradyrhizobium sp. BR 10261]|uniref:avidin/streptavidin family protein n=1 Tax=Bradyrhizobium sp. BR 10261 TaxID=2749992 RepID=UPI001C64DD80|nr:avidin/streptavidin family protein [Bradyrhizobium sp. BR 10261]MBW7960879.1 hypothetical protein [Bradyrhizobium sp. BR 10261]